MPPPLAGRVMPPRRGLVELRLRRQYLATAAARSSRRGSIGEGGRPEDRDGRWLSRVGMQAYQIHMKQIQISRISNIRFFVVFEFPSSMMEMDHIRMETNSDISDIHFIISLLFPSLLEGYTGLGYASK